MNAAHPGRTLVIAGRLAALLLVVTLVVGLLVPIYTDEVGWRFQLSRFVQDGGVDRFMAEACGANTIAVPPLFMWPVRVIGSVATAMTRDPLAVRAQGVAGALFATFLLRRLIVAITPDDPTRRARIMLFAFAAAGLGLLPFLLVWSRPEQPILLAILCAVLVAVRPSRGRRADDAARLGAVTILALFALCFHPKAIFYVPVFVAAAWVATPARGRSPLFWGAVLVMVAAAASAFHYWSVRFACPDDAVLAGQLARENASILLLGGWKSFAGAVPRLADTMLPTLYVRAASPSPM